MRMAGLIILRDPTIGDGDLCDEDLKPEFRGTPYDKITEYMFKQDAVAKIDRAGGAYNYVIIDKTPPGYYSR